MTLERVKLVLKYEDFLKNDYIVNEYSKIDKINPFAFSHGLRHINNVCNNMKMLCKILNIDDEMKDALLIACVFHDVGQADGREAHGLKAKQIIEKLFSNDIKQNKYYNEILHSVEIHDNKSIGDESLFCLLLKCADSLDFTKKRLVNDCKDKELYKVWEDIEDIIIDLKDNYLILDIITNGKENFKEKFMKQSFTKKIISSFTTLAHKINLIPVIKIDNKDRIV